MNLKPIFLCCLIVVSASQVWTPSHVNGQRRDDYTAARKQMVEVAVRGAGVTDKRVLEAMMKTERHYFVEARLREHAYLDAALPIGEQQTISSPFIVAFMTQSLDPQPTDKVLEIGTGSGYQAAVLSPLVEEVYTIEIVESLGKQAEKVLGRLAYDNVHVKIGDGYKGWPQHAPFDKIIVTCSPEEVPKPLVEQLAEGGMMVIPVGERHQQSLFLYRKEKGELVAEELRPTLFVPMTGQAEDQRQVLPDPANPKILNASFEEEPPENGFVPGWYYQRKLTWVEDESSPDGAHYVQFEGNSPGEKAHLMQGFAIDGRVIKKITLSASVKTEDVVVGPHKEDLPIVAMTFYDDLRRELGTTYIGPFQGTRDWRNYDHSIRVPEETREGILRIGLFGATGTAAFDNVFISVNEKVEPEDDDPEDDDKDKN